VRANAVDVLQSPLVVISQSSLIAGELQASGAEVTTIDTFAFITELVDSGVALGIDNVTDMCVMPNVAPFECETPNDYLFWDGIHPTKAAHRLLASVVINELGY